MFGKKKEIIKTQLDFKDWEKDLGFLNLILSRKKGITKEFIIGVYSKQKAEKDYISDEELEPHVQTAVNDVVSQIGDNYKNFLIEKYFGTYDNLIKYITEDIYVDLVSDTINRNVDKIRATVQKQQMTSVTDMNKIKQENKK